MSTQTYKVKLNNCEYWQEDDQDIVFTTVKEIETAVDDFISDTHEAYVLNFLDSPHEYDDVEVVTFDANGQILSTKNYLDFMVEMDKDFNISVGI